MLSMISLCNFLVERMFDMTRHILPVLLIGLFTNISAYAADIILNISEAKSDKGKIVASLWDSEEAYLDLDARMMRGVAQISKGAAVLRFEGMAPGTYSIALYHDENDNNEMDTNFIGIPKEGWAFSNNAKGKFGPPAFEKTSFTVGADDVQMDLAMNY